MSVPRLRGHVDHKNKNVVKKKLSWSFCLKTFTTKKMGFPQIICKTPHCSLQETILSNRESSIIHRTIELDEKWKAMAASGGAKGVSRKTKWDKDDEGRKN
jgi:hypothetical protein